jgi:hypothetical protein
MNLPDAPIAHESFFATHFFTVSDQEKSKDFYVRILGGKVCTEAKFSRHMQRLGDEFYRQLPGLG